MYTSVFPGHLKVVNIADEIQAKYALRYARRQSRRDAIVVVLSFLVAYVFGHMLLWVRNPGFQWWPGIDQVVHAHPRWAADVICTAIWGLTLLTLPRMMRILQRLCY